ncbi:hypothetical protein [Nocardiopsis synnemataformans]|uniref:hypothetical protein n=1 Tax=Nocardiopsis synnemataformans TaxID=61305 RepID=UPI003EBB70D0
MARTVVAGLAVVGALVATGCTSTPQETDPASQEVEAGTEQTQGPVVADPVEWGTQVAVPAGTGQVELTPVGLRYVTTEEITSPTEHDHPSREVFAVVRYEAAVQGEEAASISQEWGWRAGGQEHGRGDGGHAGTAPWMGAVPEVYADTPLLPGEEPTVGYATFDLPGRGGELTFTDLDGAMVRWTAPEEDTGELVELEEWLTSQQ